MGDIYPGARVVEAGVGSGGLAMSLLSAIGERGHLLSVERRAGFAEIAVANVESWFGGPHPAWEVVVGDLAEVLPARAGPATVDRVVLDMLAPWENLAAVAEALVPGGLVLAYVATTTQAQPVRGGPARHRAVRRAAGLGVDGADLAPRRAGGAPGPQDDRPHRLPRHRPPPSARHDPAAAHPAAGQGCLRARRRLGAGGRGERTVADKKVRRVRRDVARRAAWRPPGWRPGRAPRPPRTTAADAGCCARRRCPQRRRPAPTGVVVTPATSTGVRGMAHGPARGPAAWVIDPAGSPSTSR